MSMRALLLVLDRLEGPVRVCPALRRAALFCMVIVHHYAESPAFSVVDCGVSAVRLPLESDNFTSKVQYLAHKPSPDDYYDK